MKFTLFFPAVHKHLLSFTVAVLAKTQPTKLYTLCLPNYKIREGLPSKKTKSEWQGLDVPAFLF